MKILIFFILLFIGEVYAFAITPTNIDAKVELGSTETRKVRIYNDANIVNNFNLKSDDRLIRIPKKVSVAPNSYTEIEVNITPDSTIKSDFYQPKIYITQDGGDFEKISLDTGLIIKTKILVVGSEKRFGTKYDSIDFNYKFYIILIIIICLILLILKFR